MHVAILGCPFGEVGAGAVVPVFVLEAGVAGATSCSGGSATSDSVSTGYGARAGGISSLVMTCMRLPG